MASDFQKNAPYWQTFIESEQLTPAQQEQFAQYVQLLRTWNERMNLTAIIDPQEIVQYHFQDSLSVRRFYPLDTVSCIADVGAGAGFPGIPLKIVYPHLRLILIEVSSKKKAFLEEVVMHLGLEHVEVCDYDWRTFIRVKPYNVDLFVARASLAPAELIRAIRSNDAYPQATVLYFASRHWQPAPKEKQWVVDEQPYCVGEKERKLVCMKANRA